MQALTRLHVIRRKAMPEEDPKSIAQRWWTLNDERDFSGAATLCAPGCVIDWPLSNERFAKPGDWATAMERYPGVWRCTVETMMAEGDRVMTIAKVTDSTTSVTAISLFRIRDGLIAELVEYWPDPYDAPEWRAQWVTPITNAVDQCTITTGSEVIS
jgi:ketosteroid isomerase-like protein